jgi:spore photoproduct lyase
MIIHITSGCENTVIARRFMTAFPRAGIRLVQDNENARQALFASVSHTGKHHIFITNAKGEHFKVCPGTPAPYLCCYYWTLHAATNCPYDCTYCILQYYLNNPLLTVFANQDELMDQIRQRIAEEPQRLFRVGTGELADSLALDDIVQIGPELIRFAARQANMILELKTKSDKVDHLLNVPHYGKTVISWSLNPPERMARHEFCAADFSGRMRALRKVQDAGYMTAFHFDPMLIYEGWEDGYTLTVKNLFEHADAKRIAWISIGSLRFPPEMAEKVRHKFPETDLLDSEMIRGRDNKMRYFKPLRVKMYQHLYASLRKYGGEDLFIYFCMEDADVWKRVMGFAPDSNEHLDYLFAEHLSQKFPELCLPTPEPDLYRQFRTRRSWE